MESRPSAGYVPSVGSTQWRYYRNSFLVVCGRYLHTVQLLRNVNYSLNPRTKRSHVLVCLASIFRLSASWEPVRNLLLSVFIQDVLSDATVKRVLKHFRGDGLHLSLEIRLNGATTSTYLFQEHVFFFFTYIEHVRAISFIQWGPVPRLMERIGESSTSSVWIRLVPAGHAILFIRLLCIVLIFHRHHDCCDIYSELSSVLYFLLIALQVN